MVFLLGFEHDSTSVKMIQLEDRLSQKLNGLYTI